MGIPKKKSRRIVVDGRAFRWLMRPGCHCYQWDCEDSQHGATVTFQADEKRPGRVCQTRLAWSHSCSQPHLNGSVTPEIIKQVIQKALKVGWDPDAKGNAFKLEGAHIEEFETKDSIIREVMKS